jgi:deazaflavin-dependent oxidoreductase (nitroreductase family)
MIYPERASWRRRLFRAPLYLWRMGLGRPLSVAMLLLTTRGRRTGLPRRSLVECIEAQGRTYITPGWGERNLWYQNILSDPRVTVQRHGETWGAEARRVTSTAEWETLYYQAKRSPMWEAYLGYWNVSDTLEDVLAARDRLIALRLDPMPALPLAPQQTDLLWVWPVMAAAGFLLFRWRG